MAEEVKTGLVTSVKPVVAWLQTRGLDLASDLIVAAIILIVGAMAIRLMAKAFRKALDCKVGGRELLARFLVSVAVKCAWAALIIIVLERLGVAVAPLVAGLGVTGFVLGFAFQESLASLAAGVMLAFSQPFKIGDRVSVGGHEGTVKQLDMMAVVLVTDDKRRVTIPNKQAWGSAIVNFTAGETGR